MMESGRPTKRAGRATATGAEAPRGLRREAAAAPDVVSTRLSGRSARPARRTWATGARRAPPRSVGL
eukprot:7735987-Lingulodinium_polyedra.AAC.1